METATIANTPQTDVFEKHYYELVHHPVPFSLLLESFATRMLTLDNPMFQIPARYSKIGKSLIFMFDVDDTTTLGTKDYYYKQIVADRKIIKRFKEGSHANYSRHCIKN